MKILTLTVVPVATVPSSHLATIQVPGYSVDSMPRVEVLKWNTTAPTKEVSHLRPYPSYHLPDLRRSPSLPRCSLRY